MSDLSEFLLARIAEDEATARAAERYWHGVRIESATAAEEDHALRHDPARVLAKCKADRLIVEAFLDAERAVATYDHAHPTDAYWQEWGNRHALALAVELLGVPYADHPDYREEWRP